MTLPSSIDLRAYAGPVLDQGQLGACGPNALAANIHFLDHELGLTDTSISRLQTYYDARVSFGQSQGGIDLTQQDTGVIIPQMLHNAQTIGMAPESDDPYVISTFTQKPNAQTYTDALQNKITGFDDVAEPAAHNSQTIRDMIKGELVEGKAVIIGFVAKDWYPQEHGTISTINPSNSNSSGILGGHAGLVVGADDSLCGGRGGYIVQNSWGTGYGDQGFMVIPYDEFPATLAQMQVGKTNLFSIDTVTGLNGHDQTWSTQRVNGEMMYISIMDRAADLSGLDYYANQLKAGTISLAGVANSFYLSPEYQNSHQGETNAAKIDDYYVHTLGRHVDTAGLNYWLGNLASGQTLGDVFSNISADVYYNQTGVDHDYYANKINVGMTFSVTFQENSHLDVAHNDIQGVTADYNHTEIIKVGMAYDLGILT